MDSHEPKKDIPGAPELPGSRPWAKARPVEPEAPEIPEDEAVEDVEDEDGREYDPHRGDRVDILNDTTPPPKPERRSDWPETQPKPKRRVHGFLIFFILVAIAAGAFYWFALRTKPASTPVTKSTTQTSPKPSTSETTEAPLKHYDSDAFQLGLSYPEDWKVAESTGKLTITSPQTPLKGITGESQKVYVQVSIQNKQSTLPEFAKGAATAVLAGQKVTYKNPTQNQRAQTYVSFAGYASSMSGAFDAIYITGDNGYTKGQDIPMSDVVKADPLVLVKFLSCTDQTCSGTPTAISLNPTDWNNQSFSKPILDILQSLSID